MKSCILTIDTRKNDQTVVLLTIDGKEYKKTISTQNNHSQVVLPATYELLSSTQVTLKDITAILVPVDHGSFTGRRVGVAIAQTLGRLLSVPVNGKDAVIPIAIPYEKDSWSLS